MPVFVGPGLLRDTNDQSRGASRQNCYRIQMKSVALITRPRLAKCNFTRRFKNITTKLFSYKWECNRWRIYKSLISRGSWEKLIFFTKRGQSLRQFSITLRFFRSRMFKNYVNYKIKRFPELKSSSLKLSVTLDSRCRVYPLTARKYRLEMRMHLNGVTTFEEHLKLRSPQQVFPGRRFFA